MGCWDAALTARRSRTEDQTRTLCAMALVIHDLPVDPHMAAATPDELADRLEAAYSRGEAAPWPISWELARRVLEANGSCAVSDPPPGSPSPDVAGSSSA